MRVMVCVSHSKRPFYKSHAPGVGDEGKGSEKTTHRHM